MVDRIIVGPLYTNAYVVSTGKKECIVIDPGADPGQIISRLELLNVVPQAIVFTHGHLDHTAGAAEIVDHYAGRDVKVKIGVHRSDRAYLGESAEATNRELFAPLGDEAVRTLELLFTSVPKQSFFLKDGDQVLDLDFVAMHTPGHSKGSLCFYSEERKAVFTGDTLLFKTIGRTDVVNADAKKLQKSIEERLYTLPPDTRLFPGHGPFSTIEREMANNAFEPNPQI
jgi:hydroxyacylglutathione hydrolase